MTESFEGADRRAVLAGAAALALSAGAAKALTLPKLPKVTMPTLPQMPVFDGGGPGPVGETVYGAVKGTFEDGINVFKGIPYGAPTGGADRFMPPEPPPRWGGTRPTQKYGDQCPQVGAKLPTAWSSWRVDTGESEDCLVLNVWTPGLADGKKRPVMVWLHGGGFSDLSGSSLAFDGVRLCQRGDVVVVTLNHRLNMFGYLYLAQLGGPQYAASGNVGQLDLVFALQWVRDNIANFGGDPGRVTIFGESGGGGKVSTLLAMPDAVGLFHRAAIQSGPGLVAIHPDAATETARAICKAVGVSENHPSDLNSVEVPRLVDALDKVTKAGHRFGPVMDGRYLPRDPFSPDAPGVSANVPVIVGSNATETTILGAKPADFSLDFNSLKGALATALPAGVDADKLIANFRRLRPDASASDLYFLITTDRGMGAGTIALAERKAALGPAPAYVYRLEFQTPVDNLRSPHALDIPLVFDNVGKSASLLGPVAADAQKVADQMAPAWIAFAHTGSPNATGLPSWPRYDARSRSTMIFNVISRAVNDPYAEERAIIARLPAGRAGV
ncbi:MAG TPA: carboxylesterase/lipase family protein [Caulobacteraceae bacterium]|jgi:para-nitrobenzyl esterase